MSPNERIVVTRDGQRGWVDEETGPLEDSGKNILLRLENGERVLAPADLLRRQEDGSYLLDADLAELSGVADAHVVVPVVVEELAIGKRPVDSGGVRVTKQVHGETRTIDEPGFREEIEVERIPRNQVLDRPAQARQEDDTFIIPLMEEVLVIEKRLVLREEVRITRRRSEIRNPQQVTLRREEATIERIPGEETTSPEDGNSPA
jgi:uncharacterized protein (TIGR02271 family)